MFNFVQVSIDCISTKAEGGLIFISEQEAKESIDTSLSYIATIKIKWEE